MFPGSKFISHALGIISASAGLNILVCLSISASEYTAYSLVHAQVRIPEPSL
jgi:hypothetical protein